MKSLLRKSVLLFILTGASLGLALDTTMEDEPDKEYPAISVAELSETNLKQFCKSKGAGNPVSIEGTTLIFDLNLDKNIFEVEKHTPHRVKVLTLSFLKCVDGVYYFSPDYKTWQPLKDFLDISMDVCPETQLIKFILHFKCPPKQ